MNSMIASDLSFSEWAVLMNSKHPEILAQMRKSLDPLDRVIARRIMETAGENP